MLLLYMGMFLMCVMIEWFGDVCIVVVLLYMVKGNMYLYFMVEYCGVFVCMLEFGKVWLFG